ncbi:DUF3667 domain-containing protein [Flavobacterium humi]|uniref:DUF3667 domain-containing protein n=1 Tax=Flavobacterium humi TaxID=2562683 RepID=A0A4Z0LCA9_9FLAO|nr:DUF3667 domain-containing protein [Flavobacterium humi]TGD59495.1 DUF3667 domain-containing protein [Flavobacterium humi]
MNEKYCPHCGKDAKPQRIDAKYILHEIEHVLHFERGILYTIRELTIRPGQNIRDFIGENRGRLVKPILFIIVTSLIYSVISHFFQIEEGYIKLDNGKQYAVIAINKWIQDHYGYANILMGVFIAFWLRLFFKKHGYNFFEILILLCFVIGMGMLMLAVFAIVEGIVGIQLMKLSVTLVFIYSTWAIGQFFDGRKPVSYIKSFISYVLGTISFGISATILGILIDLILKHY